MTLPVRYTNSLDNISNEINKLSTIPKHNGNAVDVAARLNALKKSLDKVVNDYKEHLWSNVSEEGGKVSGDFFTCTMQYNDVHRFQTNQFKQQRPGLYKRFVTSNLEKRTTFAPKG